MIETAEDLSVGVNSVLQPTGRRGEGDAEETPPVMMAAILTVVIGLVVVGAAVGGLYYRSVGLFLSNVSSRECYA